MIKKTAIAQAKTEKLYVFSGEKDPTFPYGEAQEVTLRELRTNISEYVGAKVVFEGVHQHYKNGENERCRNKKKENESYYISTVFQASTSLFLVNLS